MEFEYSPTHHSPTNAIHLLSPSHAHAGLQGFSSLRQLRRSLSRSPSKPSRFSIVTTKSCAGQNSTPASPSALGRSISSDGTSESISRTRSVSKRTYPAPKLSPKSPFRRALSDNANQGNLTPRILRRSSSEQEQENIDVRDETSKSTNDLKHEAPTPFDFARPRSDIFLQPVLKEHAPPKSSPLKRSDGLMDLEAATTLSPRAKRRSVHGTMFGSDFNVFDHGFDDSSSAGPADDLGRQFDGTASLPYPSASSPHRRHVNLRKSTLQQRGGPARTRLSSDVFNEGSSSPALTRARSRISLDGALLQHTSDFDSAFRRNSAENPPVSFAQPNQRLYQSAPKPHPLSNALTPSSSSSSMAEEQPHHPQQQKASMPPALHHAPHLPSTFSRSLPLGANRPSPASIAASQASQGSYATPSAFKMTKPFPQAFMSTGLISKRNRNVESPAFAAGPMPDTPSKKTHGFIVPPRGGNHFSPAINHEFGSPSTPFHHRVADHSPETYRSSNIFGVAPPDLHRRGSFLSVHDNDQSPTDGMDGPCSVDDLPPTPTKAAHSGPRPQSKGKSNSLRSSLFGRRTSLGADTFTPPTPEVVSPQKSTTPTESVDIQVSPNGRSPHTPCGSFGAPDASTLSISAERNSSLFPSNSFPPATPTGPRDQPFNKSMGQSFASSGYFANDVDTSMTSRFSAVVTHGIGEFSQVYKVEGQVRPSASPSAGGVHTVWAVKKSRKPYIGIKDRLRKMQEVHILKQLRGNEHVVEYVDSWESKNHLYIQTQFCENGNLKDFLTQTGFKGRLDDFRIWKILLELSQGIKSIHDNGIIHLDIKPANVFIDWEGVLKIGDFGLASTWPAPVGIDGEGDREYIGPEVLSGRFDKPADVFSLGMVMLEIAGNIVLPDNGKSWQRLRAGDMSDLPSLTWSSDSSLLRNESGEPIDLLNGPSQDSICMSHCEEDDLDFLRNPAPMTQRSQELVEPPNFMVDAQDPEALDKVVQWMICPDPDRRPVIDELLAAGGVEWVARRRRAGATVYEGNWGPADDVLDSNEHDVEMVDI